MLSNFDKILFYFIDNKNGILVLYRLYWKTKNF